VLVRDDDRRVRVIERHSARVAADWVFKLAMRDRAPGKTGGELTADSRVRLLAEAWYTTLDSLSPLTLQAYRDRLDRQILPRLGTARLRLGPAVSRGAGRSLGSPVPPRSLPSMAAPGLGTIPPLCGGVRSFVMTSSTLLTPLTTSADVRDLEQASLIDDAVEAMDKEACDICPHPRSGHDAIAARFCSATGNGAIARGCVCQS